MDVSQTENATPARTEAGVAQRDASGAARMALSVEPPMGNDPIEILIETGNAALLFHVDDDRRLFQRKFGCKAVSEQREQVAFPTGGSGWTFEPALNVIHADGNTSTDLRVAAVSLGPELSRISLKDPEYPFFVDLVFRASVQEDVIETWTEIHHEENGEAVLDRFASSSLDLGDGPMVLTQFHGDWASEMQMAEEPITFGIKVLDSKLGVRAHQFLNPSFLISKGAPAAEESGEVIGGSLAWSGSFQFSFERTPDGRVRALCGMNPFGSAYRLEPGEMFCTPHMVWAWSGAGTGTLSRNLHRWVRANVLRDPNRPRAVLLNNWEATYFNFNTEKLTSLFEGARAIGMELFLLDDGWFGVKYPRDDDSQGLGDWIPDPGKLPLGIQELTRKASERGIRFGIWVEPEMVNPRSRLFEEHPDWVIRQPKRSVDLQRNQLVLDLSNPAVEEFVFTVVDRIIEEDPGISYIKWDCNRYLTQSGSPYLARDRQTHLQIEYVRALYRVMNRLSEKYPQVEIMMCSGGGGRVDYASLSFAHEYWPSDMTDPAHRIFIQWGYSYFFPAIASGNHVTKSGDRSLRFALDVAMSGALGMDVDVDKLSADDMDLVKRAVHAYKGIRDVVQLGDLYRLESPYAGPRSALMFVRDGRAVVFAYSLGNSVSAPLRMRGLDPACAYEIREIDPSPGATVPKQSASGGLLMDQGLALPAMRPFSSRVFEITS